MTQVLYKERRYDVLEIQMTLYVCANMACLQIGAMTIHLIGYLPS